MASSFFPKWQGRVVASSSVLRQYGSIAASNLVMGASTVVDQGMAATLGAGSVSLLNFGTRLPGVLLSIGPLALSTAILPRLSKIAASGDRLLFRRTVKTVLLVSMAAMVPVVAALIGFSVPIVRLLFQRLSIHLCAEDGVSEPPSEQRCPGHPLAALDAPVFACCNC